MVALLLNLNNVGSGYEETIEFAEKNSVTVPMKK